VIRILILCLLVIILHPASVYSCPDDGFILEELLDKNGNVFNLCKQNIPPGYSRQGRSSDIYYIEGNDEKKHSSIYTSNWDAVEGGCGNGRPGMLQVETALADFSGSYKDINADGYKDIILSITEQNCNTNEIIKFTKILLATENGFEEIKE